VEVILACLRTFCRYLQGESKKNRANLRILGLFSHDLHRELFEYTLRLVARVLKTRAFRTAVIHEDELSALRLGMTG
jgi:hypothetical protein